MANAEDAKGENIGSYSVQDVLTGFNEELNKALEDIKTLQSTMESKMNIKINLESNVSSLNKGSAIRSKVKRNKGSARGESVDSKELLSVISKEISRFATKESVSTLEVIVKKLEDNVEIHNVILRRSSDASKPLATVESLNDPGVEKLAEDVASLKEQNEIMANALKERSKQEGAIRKTLDDLSSEVKLEHKS